MGKEFFTFSTQELLVPRFLLRLVSALIFDFLHRHGLFESLDIPFKDEAQSAVFKDPVRTAL